MSVPVCPHPLLSLCVCRSLTRISSRDSSVYLLIQDIPVVSIISGQSALISFVSGCANGRTYGQTLKSFSLCLSASLAVFIRPTTKFNADLINKVGGGGGGDIFESPCPCVRVSWLCSQYIFISSEPLHFL